MLASSAETKVLPSGEKATWNSIGACSTSLNFSRLIRRSNFRVPTSHKEIIGSVRPADARTRPSGEKAAVVVRGCSGPPSSLPSSLPVDTSRRRMGPPPPMATTARCVPSGDSASGKSFSASPSRRSSFPLATSQRRIVPSPLPETSFSPLGKKATNATRS